MAIIIRKKGGFVSGVVDNNPLLIAGTTLSSSALAALPAVSSPDIAVICLDIDASAGAQEIVYVTAHTAAATTATIARAKEGTTAREHAQNIKWAHLPTSKDFLPDNTTAGHILTVQDANDGIAAWAAPADKEYISYHTWAISGEIKVAVGQTDFIPPMFVFAATGETLLLKYARLIINDGTSATCKLQVNNSDASGFTGIAVTQAGDTITGSVSLSHLDKINLIVTAVSNTPKNMSFTIGILHTQ